MTPPLVSVIIPVLNNFALTRDCLHSLHAHAPDAAMEVVVVDNGSSDATATDLEPLGAALFPDRFRCIRFAENRNFGPACNAGAQAAQGEYLFFLNNDTLLTPDWFPPLLNGLDDTCQATGPLLLYPKQESLLCDRVQHLGVCCEPQLLLCHLYEFFPASHRVVRKRRTLQFLTGAALFLRRKLFLDVGMFHEGYRNGGEDLDLCVQIRRQGFTLACLPESRIYHLQSQTVGRHDHEAHNGALFKERCLEHIFPDLHLHLQGDGYELALNDQLMPHARLPERRHALLEKGFFRESSAPAAAACRAMLEQEPLFAPAYDRLADLCEQDGDHALLVRIRFLQTRFFPSREAGVRLLDAARLADDGAMVAEGERFIAAHDAAGSVADPVEVAREMVHYGEQLRQPAISDLYARWLETRPQQ